MSQQAKLWGLHSQWKSSCECPFLGNSRGEALLKVLLHSGPAYESEKVAAWSQTILSKVGISPPKTSDLPL